MAKNGSADWDITSKCAYIEIERLQLLIVKLKRMQFGTSSEKLARHIDQLELQLEELETKRAEASSVNESTGTLRQPVRRALPLELPRDSKCSARCAPLDRNQCRCKRYSLPGVG
jgi:hypothetical protein